MHKITMWLLLVAAILWPLLLAWIVASHPGPVIHEYCAALEGGDE